MHDQQGLLLRHISQKSYVLRWKCVGGWVVQIWTWIFCFSVNKHVAKKGLPEKCCLSVKLNTYKTKITERTTMEETGISLIEFGGQMRNFTIYNNNKKINLANIKQVN